ncbi:unnamed protein product [Paramecium pentaurelia]|uniref:C2H2-type domain-containing protein n=2 Tax=Paramecium pentaurelia TaxID=43138 RepID=A0A8S1V155_9CILI|nr:unnamed protein product [Paramecium pentaurelia]
MQERNTHYCSNCQITIPNDQEYQAHYRSDFHRYNIRRRLMNLESVSFEIFQKKFLESQSNTSCSSSQAQTYSCTTCKKNFFSSGTYSQHLNSAKHKQVLKDNRKNSDSLEKKQIQNLPEQCLFCEYTYETVDQVYNHMNTDHGFFIREKDSLVDMKGLIECLRNIIEKQFYCLSCPSIFASSDSAKQHMLDKGHCFMPNEHYDELCHFYDFTEKIKKLLQLDEIPELSELSFEEILELDSLKSDSRISEFEVVEQTPEQQARRAQLMHYIDIINQNRAKVLPNGELQLPNGKILGHRSLKQFYDQSHVVPLPQKNNHLPLQYQTQQAIKNVGNDFI